MSIVALLIASALFELALGSDFWPNQALLAIGSAVWFYNFITFEPASPGDRP